jgi:hypothetical protein
VKIAQFFFVFTVKSARFSKLIGFKKNEASYYIKTVYGTVYWFINQFLAVLKIDRFLVESFVAYRVAGK